MSSVSQPNASVLTHANDFAILTPPSANRCAFATANAVGSSITKSAPPRISAPARVNLSVIATSPRCVKLPLMTAIFSSPVSSLAVRNRY